MPADEANGGVLRPDELAAQQATTLPQREAMTLLDPNLLGGGLVSGPTGTDPTQGTTGTDAGSTAAQPLTQSASQTTTQSSDLASRLMPDTSSAAGQPYQPSATSSAQS